MAGSICVSSVRRVRPFGAGSTTFAAKNGPPRCLPHGLRGCVVARLTTSGAALHLREMTQRRSPGRNGPKFFVAPRHFVCSSSLAISWHSSQNSLNSLARFASANNAYTLSGGASMMPFAKTQACFSLSFLRQTFVLAPSSEICVQRGSRSSIKASTVATAAALSLLRDFGDGPSVASRAIDCLGFCTSLARSFVSGVARAVAARSSNARRACWLWLPVGFAATAWHRAFAAWAAAMSAPSSPER